jgi:uncharacterized protein (TIGR02452 family)
MYRPAHGGEDTRKRKEQMQTGSTQPQKPGAVPTHSVIGPVATNAAAAPASNNAGAGMVIGKGDTAVSSDLDPSRKQLFVEIRKDNYTQRNAFGRVPETLHFSFDRCDAAFQKIAADRGKRGMPKVIFSAKSTADVLLDYGRRKEIVCGLNFANGTQVGGGYMHGSLAQEEDLCRRMPTLYTSLNRAKERGIYPIGPSTCKNIADPQKYSDVLYTQGLIIARLGEDKRFEMLPRGDQATVSLVTAAAPNIKHNEIVEERLLWNTVKNIFVAPLFHQPEVTTIVLGAWGCGAFGGDAVMMSKLFARAIKEEGLGHLYQEIHFAILPSSKSGPSDNPQIFLDTFKKYGIQATSQ